MTKSVWAAIVIAGLGLVPAGAQSSISFTGRDSVAVSGQAGQRSVWLGRRHLFAGSDTICLRGRQLVRDGDYAINYQRGEVYFSEPLETGDTAIVVFRALAVALPESVCYAPASSADSLVAGPDSGTGGGVSHGRFPAPAGAGRETASQVRFGGSKSFTITAGSGRDLSLEQSLNISATGQLAPGLEVNALLSDRNLPLSQAGSTEELSQLDKMYIQAKTDRWSATLGDLEVSSPALSLLQFNRQAEGVQAEGRTGKAAASAAYSVSKGKPAVNRFNGQEGKQGPYKLTPDDGSADFRVLANSQKVWLNGELLQPGAAADYILDFDRAELTFTPRRPVNGDSRIVAQFQYSSQLYRRSMYFAAARMPLGENAGLQAAYFRETDDPDHVSGEALSDSQRAALGRAGNDTAKLWVDGGTRVDPGAGSYLRNDSAYVFEPSGRGDYAVAFTAVGTGLGDYVYDSVLGGFRYVGARNGDYRAIKRLVSPQSRQVVNIRSEFRWDGGRSYIEGSSSRHDANVLSPVDDGRNAGQAGTAFFSWKRDTLPWGGFELRSAITTIGSSYRNSEMERSPDFEAQWGLNNWQAAAPPDPGAARQAIDLYGSYTLLGNATVGAGWGRLGFIGGLWNRKYLLTSTLAFPSWPRIQYWYKRYLIGNAWLDRPAASGRRDLHQAFSHWQRSGWGIDAGFTSNLDVIGHGPAGSSGARYWESSLGWSRQGNGWESGQTFLRRDDSRRDTLARAWIGQSYTTALTSRSAWRRADRLNISIDHTFRQVRLRPGVAGRGNSSHLAALHADHARRDGQLRLTLDYSLSNSETALQQELFVRVPERTGDYSYDPATASFFPDTAGNYRRTISDQGTARMTTENTGRAYVSIAPARAAGWWRGSRLDLLASSAISAPGAADLKALAFQRDRLWRESNLRSHLDLSSDLSYAAPAGWNVRGHLRWRREADNRFAGRHSGTITREQRCDAFIPLPPAGRLSLYAENTMTEASTVETGLETGVVAVRAGGDGGWQLGPEMELAVKGSAARERLTRASGYSSGSAAAYRSLSAAPYATRQLGRSGQARCEIGLEYRTSRSKRSEIPLEFAYTRPLGLTKTWSLQYDYRISNYLTSSAGYDGRKEPDQRPAHTARFDLRAYF